MLVAACGSGTAEPGLSGGGASLEGLAGHYLDAVRYADTAAMHALRVTRNEHNQLMWPHFPIARPELNWSVDFAWDNLERRSRRDALRIALDYGEKPWQLLGIACSKGVDDYGPFRIHGDCWLDVRLDGPTVRLKMFGSVVEMHGRYKIVGILAD